MGQVTVTINGRTYRLACGDGDEARVAELAAHVSMRMERLVAEVGNAGQDVLLLMVALLLADEVAERTTATGAAGKGDGVAAGDTAEAAAKPGGEPKARASRAAGRA